MKIKSTVVCGVAVIALTALMAGCHRSPSSSQASNSPASHVCSGNPYLMRYGCSLSRIQTAAENGSADAQYALGYMYYYGIDTVQDRQTADLWIQRSAAQGQPLAKKAWSLINSGATFTDLHQAATGNDKAPYDSRSANTIVQQEPADVDKMNTTVPTEPITKHLPAYTTTPSQSSNHINNMDSTATSTPPIAENHSIHDSRLSPNSKPIVASAAQSSAAFSAQPATAKPAKMAENTAKNYTVQLLASEKLSDIKNYMTAHHLGSKAAYFETRLDGKPWYMLTYGQYGSASRAQIALQNMPQDLQNHHPWVKSLATVKKEVRLQKVLA